MWHHWFLLLLGLLYLQESDALAEVGKEHGRTYHQTIFRQLKRSRSTQEDCSICGDNVDALLGDALPVYDFPDTPPNQNCQQLDELAKQWIPPGPGCDGVTSVLAPQCCSGFEARCSICGDNNAALTGDKLPVYDFPDMPTNQTCQQMDELAGQYSDCDAVRSVLAPQCCGSFEATCSICGTAELQKDVKAIYPEGVGLEPNLTCAELDDLFSFIPAGDQCNGIKLFYEQCCIGVIPVYQCEKNIRNKILEESDSTVPPIVSAKDPINISVELQFMHVTDINEQESTAQIFVWLIMSWKDPRLAWVPDEDHCSRQVNARASIDVEKAEIWVPDFDLFNQVDGVQALPDATADVYADGTVSWRRNGPLVAICQFTGLAQIPFDTLGCQFLFGMWERQSALAYPFNFTLGNELGTGLSIGPFQSTYSQYKLVPGGSKAEINSYGRQVTFTFYFSRAQQHYVFNIIIPTIILTFISFGTFLLDIRTGERLGYGLTLALVVVAQQIITADLLPVSSEKLWIDKFGAWSFYFVIFGLLESVIIGYIHFLREDAEEKNQSEREDDELRQSRQPTATELQKNSALTRKRHQYQAGVNQALSGSFLDSSKNGNASEVQSLRQVLDHIVSDLPEPPQSFNGGSDDGIMDSELHVREQVQKGRSKLTPMWKQKLDRLVYEKWTLRQVDHGFFFFTTISYLVFCIVMFITGKSLIGEDCN